MIRHGVADKESSRYWDDWASRVWQKSHAKWQSRDGQDNYYRERVVLPALVEAVEEWSAIPSAALVDFGAGDGYTTARLSTLLQDRGYAIQPIVLLERSRRELEVARNRLGLQQAISQQCNFVGNRAAKVVKEMVSKDTPVILTAVFVLQELPDMVPMLSAVSEALHGQGLFLAVIVAPEFAEDLRRSGGVKISHVPSASTLAWKWAGLYPIAVPSGVLRLPHFQYTQEKVEELYTKAGLQVRGMRELTLPDDEDARQIFDRTVYGNAILGRPSSLLIVATCRECKSTQKGIRDE